MTILPDKLKRETNIEDWTRDRELVLRNTIKSHEYNKKLFDKNRKQHRFEVGVYVENGNKLNRRKLDILRTGPFEIVDKISNSMYKINTGRRKPVTNLFHITKLTPIVTEENETDKEDLEEDT